MLKRLKEVPFPSNPYSNGFACYTGYLVLVRHEGKIIATHCNNSRFMKDEWMNRLADPVK